LDTFVRGARTVFLIPLTTTGTQGIELSRILDRGAPFQDKIKRPRPRRGLTGGSPVARKRRPSQDEESFDDVTDLEDDEPKVRGKAKDDDEDDDEDSVGLDEVEEDTDDEDEAADSEEDIGKSVEDLEKKRLFMSEAEEAMENLTLDDIREVLKDNDMDPKMASRLKKLLSEVIEEGEVASMEEAWEEALDRLDEEL